MELEDACPSSGEDGDLDSGDGSLGGSAEGPHSMESFGQGPLEQKPAYTGEDKGHAQSNLSDCTPARWSGKHAGQGVIWIQSTHLIIPTRCSVTTLE